MPWKEQTMSEKRTAFVQEVLTGKETKKAICARYGISRPTGDKWLARYRAGESMEDRSRRPRQMPRKTSPDIEEAIIALRAEHPALGARKLKRILENRGHTVPGHSTVNAILHRNGWISEAASQAARPYTRFERSRPNELWQADFKGHFPMRNGAQCHPLNLLDDHSRYCLRLDAKGNEQLDNTWETFVQAFRQYGLPEAILCDNGSPWGTSAVRGYTRFERMLLDLDIRPIHGRPFHPQTQGKDERFNQTLKRELLAHHDLADLWDAQQQFDPFRHFYNEERPHHALGLDVPASRYTASSRPYPEEIMPFAYPQGLQVRRVKHGCVKYRGGLFFLSNGFDRTSVALRPAEDSDGVVEVLYRNWLIATLDLRDRKVTRIIRRVTDFGPLG